MIRRVEFLEPGLVRYRERGDTVYYPKEVIERIYKTAIAKPVVVGHSTPVGTLNMSPVGVVVGAYYNDVTGRYEADIDVTSPEAMKYLNKTKAVSCAITGQFVDYEGTYNQIACNKVLVDGSVDHIAIVGTARLSASRLLNGVSSLGEKMSFFTNNKPVDMSTATTGMLFNGVLLTQEQALEAFSMYVNTGQGAANTTAAAPPAVQMFNGGATLGAVNNALANLTTTTEVVVNGLTTTLGAVLQQVRGQAAAQPPITMNPPNALSAVTTGTVANGVIPSNTTVQTSTVPGTLMTQEAAGRALFGSV